jgi:putative ABC transport system permease protein
VIDRLLQDLRYAARRLWREKTLSSVAIVTLALGIGANTAMFSLVSAILLRPLPYAEPDRLVMIWKPDEPGTTTWLAVPEAESYRHDVPSYSSMGYYTDGSVNLTGGMEPERVNAAAVTVGVFQTLGVEPLLGRAIDSTDDVPGSDAVMLAYGLWQRRFGGDDRIIGRPIKVNGEDRIVIGVMPPEFRLPLDFREETPTQLWYPLGVTPNQRANWGDHSYIGFARLQRGAEPARATSEMDLALDSWIAAGNRPERDRTAMRREALPMQEFLTGGIRSALLVLSGAVGLVLLIACVNVANLLLARADARRREVAVRAALGAGRGRVLRQLLTESTVLALAGSVAGLGLTLASIRLLVALRPAGLPRLDQVALDLPTLGFTAVLALLTGILFGLVPALNLSRPDLAGVLKEGGPTGTAGPARHRFRRGLVVAEMALSVILMVGAGLLIRSLIALHRVDLGFNERNVLTLRVTLPGSSYPEAADVVSFFERATERIRLLPRVRSVGATRILPLSGTIGDWSITLKDRPAEPGENPNGDWQVVTDGYFETMGMTLVKGRFLTSADRAGNPLVVVINETMALAYWPDREPLGQQFHLGTRDQPWMTIVGVVRTSRHNAVVEGDRQEMFVPHAQFPAQTGNAPRGMTLVVRTEGDPRDLMGPARGVIRVLDPGLPVSDIRTMEQVTSDALSAPRFTALLLGTFAAAALLLAAIGVYGTLSLLVAQRSHEIGIRMALGAARGSILRMILGQGMALAGAGVAAGLAGAFLLTRLLERLVYGVGAIDPVTFAIVPLVLAGTALLACAWPARRAAGVDPAAMLRRE